MDVEVVDIRKITGDGVLKAFADIRIGEALIIKGVTIMKGKNGIFVSMPRKASKDGRWFDVLEAEDSLKCEIEEKVLEAYDRETSDPSIQAAKKAAEEIANGAGRVMDADTQKGVVKAFKKALADTNPGM